MEQQTIPFNLEYFRAGNKAYLKLKPPNGHPDEFSWIADRPNKKFVVVDRTWIVSDEEYDSKLQDMSIHELETQTYMHPPVFYSAIDRRFGIFLTREQAEKRKDGLFTIGPDAVIVSISHEQYQAIQAEMKKTE